MRARLRSRALVYWSASLLFLEIFGGTLLAFRWPAPVGNITISRFAALLVLGTLAVSRIAMPILWRRLMVGASFVVATWATNVLYSVNPHLGVVQVLDLLEGLIMLFGSARLFMTACRRDSTNAPRILASAALAGFVPSGILGLYQAALLARGRHPVIPLIGLSRLNAGTVDSARTAFGSGLNQFNLDRVAGATGDPPTFGVICAIAIVFALWLRRQGLLRRRGVVYPIVMATSVVGIVLSASLTAVLVLAVGLASAGRLRLPVSALNPFRLGAAAALLGVAATNHAGRGFLLSAKTRIFAFFRGGGSAGDHKLLLSQAWRAWLAHPLLGVGAGSLSSLVLGQQVTFSSVHNTFVLRLAEGGLMGAIALVWYFLRLYRLSPFALFAPIAVSLCLYEDFDRMPSMWAVLGLGMAVQTMAAGQPFRPDRSYRSALESRHRDRELQLRPAPGGAR